MKNTLIAISLVFGLVAVLSSSSAADVCTSMADSLAAAGFHDAAITEYKRYLFFNPEGAEAVRCLAAVSDAYRELGEMEPALEAARSASQMADSDSLRDDLRLDAAEILRDMGELSTAELEFSRVLVFTDNDCLRARAVRLVADCRLRDERWSGLRDLLTLSEQWKSDLAGTPIDSLLTELESLHLKSPDAAVRLSTFLPGAGQIYAGNVVDGIHALAVNGFFVFVLASAVAEGSIGDAIFDLSVLRRYYTGNRANAAMEAHEHNTRLIGPRLEQLASEIDRWDPCGCRAQ